MPRAECWLLLAMLLLASCKQQNVSPLDDLSALKNGFLEQISSNAVDEGPFSFDYRLRTTFFSQGVISLLGELTVQDRLPHGWCYYEGKTCCRVKGKWRELTLNDLFPTSEKREFLLQACEVSLKHDPLSHFSGDDPLRTALTQEEIRTFVLDDQHLIIVFQPYAVGGCADGPFTVKIPFADLKGRWEEDHPLHASLQGAISSQDFICWWDPL
jgi:hypothetical protein